MRFFPEGPRIPDELLEERDRGNVVFFCGAGVSLSAGLPTFLGLCKHVVKELGVPASANSRTMLQFYDDTTSTSPSLPPLDQVFNELQQEYRSGEIEYVISRRLRPRRGATLAAHETILRLSKSAHGNPQIVTTNFDYLFEKASKPTINIFKSPALPDLTNHGSLEGLVYLHGRINGRMRPSDGPQGLVLSSSDFGRAYLAEGWATRFVRNLLDRYTVVMLGYSANDPPVRYLLQGLHTRVYGQTPSIYAFDHGSDDEVRQRWRDSGVTALAYTNTDEEHSALWSTLDAWADRADDPMEWRRSTVQLALRGPRSLNAEQRGQVVSILRTDVGAKLFADSDPPPPADWICVLDSRVRYKQPTTDFAPLAEYGIDDDPTEPPDANVLLIPGSVGPGYDLIRLHSGESQRDSQVRLAGIPRRWTDPLSPRLNHLSTWIGKVLHDPVMAWWASRYETLHPAVLAEIERRLDPDQSDLPPPAREVWLRLIEIFRTVPAEESDDSWHDTTTRVRAEGWTPSVLRSFARATQPYATVRPSFVLSASGIPPGSDWPEHSATQVVYFEVKFPPDDPTDLADIPDEVIPKVYRILRGHLEWAADLLADIHQSEWWHTSTFYPENHAGADSMLGGASTYLHCFRSILDRLIELNPARVKHDVALWPNDERFFFDKLRLYVWSRPHLIPADVVAKGLLEMSDNAFWDFYTRRELLMLLNARWPDFSTKHRRAIEDRIADGNPTGMQDD
ncbi:MAG: SIR2 family protein [Rhodospirillaceae bacterium]|nr:SIR2 family protein [Rhodospirillaceae bacterium]